MSDNYHERNRKCAICGRKIIQHYDCYNINYSNKKSKYYSKIVCEECHKMGRDKE